MTTPDTTPHVVRITAICIPDAARALAAAYGRRITEAQVRQVAQHGGLIRPGDTLNLLEYVAFLAKEVAHGPDTRHGAD